MPAINDDNAIARVLQQARIIAVVGMSMDPSRDSHQVARYMQENGYRVIPVNPSYSGETILGERCCASLHEAAERLEGEGRRIDIVDCFRRSEAMETIADDAIDIGAPCLWMQLGVVNQLAADRALAAGLTVVMDRCIKVEHAYS